MTPMELSSIHPSLFHVAEGGAADSILAHGLLTAKEAISRAGLAEDEVECLHKNTRKSAVHIKVSNAIKVVLNDQAPLSAAALERCLDDNLKPIDWLEVLASRVFLWPSVTKLAPFVSARLRAGRTATILMFDSLSFLEAFGDRVELSAINSGSTVRSPARRGLATFTPLGLMSYSDWSKRRGKRDKISEVVCLGSILDCASYCLEIDDINCRADLERYLSTRSQ